MTTLSLHDVTFAYPSGTEALRGVTWEGASGTLVAVLGPNGGGKSTLLRIAAGLETPGTGRAALDGRPVRDLAREARARRIAFLPQSITPTYSYPVAEVVGFGRYPFQAGALRRWTAADAAAVDDALRQTDTDHLADRPFHHLSGGERQRVLLASLLVQAGDVLLLDEPTTALDLHHQVQLMRLLKRLAEESRLVVWSTHDLNLAATFADAVVLLDAGQVVAQGSVAEVMTASTLSGVYGDSVWVGQHPGTGQTTVLPWVKDDA